MNWKKIERWIVLPAVAIVVAVGTTGVYWYHRPLPPIVVGRATTWLIEPLKADGTIDYDAAINAELGAGVTRENNAAPLLAALAGNPFDAQGPDADRLLEYKIERNDEAGDDSDFHPRYPGSDPAREALLERAFAGSWSEDEQHSIDVYAERADRTVGLALAAIERGRFHLPWSADISPDDLTSNWEQSREIVSTALVFHALGRSVSGEDAAALRDLDALLTLAGFAMRRGTFSISTRDRGFSRWPPISVAGSPADIRNGSPRSSPR